MCGFSLINMYHNFCFLNKLIQQKAEKCTFILNSVELNNKKETLMNIFQTDPIYKETKETTHISKLD